MIRTAIRFSCIAIYRNSILGAIPTPSDYAARNRARDKLASAVCSVQVLSRVDYPGSWIMWVFRYIEDWQSTLPHVICRLAYFGSCTRTRRSELSGRRSIFRAIGRADLTCGSVQSGRLAADTWPVTICFDHYDCHTQFCILSVL